ncbi:MAG: metalloregulator ArsR/SmtB family transcription factor [Planctomycetota bacterium]
MAPLFAALSDGNRLRLLGALFRCGELCACQLTDLLQVAGSTTSRHMGLLLACGLVESRKEGRWVYYRVNRENAELSGLLPWIEEQLASDPQVRRDSKALKRIAGGKAGTYCSSK